MNTKIKTLLAGIALTAVAAVHAGPFDGASMPPAEMLRIGIMNHNLEKVKTAIELGADPNKYMAPNGDTALTLAYRVDAPKIVQYLLDNPKVSVTLENRNGESPLMLAAFKGDMADVDELVRRGASPVKDIGWTPLHYAATVGNVEMMDKLVKLGANVNAQTDAGVTPLMMAARMPSQKAVVYLLRHGAYRDVCTFRGQSPADYAEKAGDIKLAEYLKIERCAVKGFINPDARKAVQPVTVVPGGR